MLRCYIVMFLSLLDNSCTRAAELAELSHHTQHCQVIYVSGCVTMLHCHLVKIMSLLKYSCTRAAELAELSHHTQHYQVIYVSRVAVPSLAGWGSSDHRIIVTRNHADGFG
jgi:hypothetical protein